jgi:hypothetical protein
MKSARVWDESVERDTEPPNGSVEHHLRKPLWLDAVFPSAWGKVIVRLALQTQARTHDPDLTPEVGPPRVTVTD